MIEGRTSSMIAPPRLPPMGANRAVLMILGDRANLLIVREAFRGTRRYQDFKERLGMSDAVLASRLHDLVDMGVFRTVQYSQHPPRSEYRLTDCGVDFWPVAIGIWMWERRWGHRADGRLPALTHLVCGNLTAATFGCGGCATTRVTASGVDIDVTEAVDYVSNAPIRRYRRASWRPAEGIDLFSEIDPLMGDRWTVATLAATMVGVDRFADLQRALEISPPLLSKRLAELVRREVLEKVMVAAGGHHHRYRLRPKGFDLMPIMVTNYAWTNRWFPVDIRPLVRIIHTACRDELVPAWFCSECGKELGRSTMSFDIHAASQPARTDNAMQQA